MQSSVNRGGVWVSGDVFGSCGISHKDSHDPSPRHQTVFSFFPQYNYMNRNETAVREEMVHLANLVDSVSK